MIESEAIHLAHAAAVKLNWPWEAGTVVARRKRLWPLPATWKVVSHVATPNALVTVMVSERKGEARPVRIIYPVRRGSGSRPRRDRRWQARVAVTFGVGAVVAFAIARSLLGWSHWIALPVAGLWGWLLSYVLLSARSLPSVRQRDSGDDRMP